MIDQSGSLRWYLFIPHQLPRAASKSKSSSRGCFEAAASNLSRVNRPGFSFLLLESDAESVRKRGSLGLPLEYQKANRGKRTTTTHSQTHPSSREILQVKSYSLYGFYVTAPRLHMFFKKCNGKRNWTLSQLQKCKDGRKSPIIPADFFLSFVTWTKCLRIGKTLQSGLVDSFAKTYTKKHLLFEVG